MTIEIESTRKRFGGLRQETHRRLFDYRRWTRRISPSITESSASLDRILALRIGDIRSENPAPDEFVFVHPKSEDHVEVRKTPHLLDEGVTTTLAREDINNANLVSKWGERVIWRETQPGDYPPLEPDQILDPTQLDLELA